ncbi:uncharacterized protein LOC112502834 [Cynara cardunculus var. scolymus]|uniref:uncharacterized protein LOC112502834 n=1 Tax=Cynara cardunculus var. scolymus TaxID=59895 RepID=UPI000D6292B0|nr:uncharacterized protein LOC112502834 [Cynara cardunculus var. scolymus]
MDPTSVNLSDNAEDPSEVREGEIRSDARPSSADAATEPVAPATNEVEAPRDEAEAEVVNEIPTFYEAPTAEEVDVVRVDVEAHGNHLPITSTTDVEEDDEEDDDEDGESSNLPDASSDLDDDDDEDDSMIQYQRPDAATKGVALRDSASQGE